MLFSHKSNCEYTFACLYPLHVSAYSNSPYWKYYCLIMNRKEFSEMDEKKFILIFHVNQMTHISSPPTHPLTLASISHRDTWVFMPA
jgi:hypothetical protein